MANGVKENIVRVAVILKLLIVAIYYQFRHVMFRGTAHFCTEALDIAFNSDPRTAPSFDEDSGWEMLSGVRGWEACYIPAYRTHTGTAELIMRRYRT